MDDGQTLVGSVGEIMKNIFIVLFSFLVLVLIGKIVLDDFNKKSNKLTQEKPKENIQQDPNEEKQQPKEEIIGPQEALGFILAADIEKNLNYLCSPDLEGRMSGKNGNTVAAEFIKKEFEEDGLTARYHKFGITRMNNGPKNEAGFTFTQNIYAVVEGSDPVLKNEIVIVGAHMDHIGYGPNMSRTPRRIEVHPGADDNASGTVALLEIAEAFSKLSAKPKRTIVFQAYSAEEMGLLGSRYYCDNPVYPEDNPDIQKHVFMLNMDMVGRLGAGEYFTGFNESDSSLDITFIINQLSEKYSFGKSITGRRTGGSDHASFYNKRVPIAFLHTGGHADYHTPSDTPDKINFAGLEQIAKYAFELTYEVANSDVTPVFNVDNFVPMDYKHDHGILEFVK
jgi:hypothetical protein